MKIWKNNWDDTKSRFQDWWNQKGVIAGTWTAPRTSGYSHADIPCPPPPANVERKWTDIDWRCQNTHYEMAHSVFPLETLPVADPWLGPGSMALYLGSEPGFEPNTVWYNPIISAPETYGTIRFDDSNKWWRSQMNLIDRMIKAAEGHYLIGTPDLVENWDVLASLRDTQTLLMDMLERPSWVKERIAEINQAWFKAYDSCYEKIRAQDGSSMFGWFRVWAPGKVAKVQCDGSAMFSTAMFREFVLPALTEQCSWLDYSIFHLDGSQCIPHLEALLEIESLDAIEWTPEPGQPGGGSAQWYDLYKRIRLAGKSIQVLGAAPEEYAPLLDAVGHDGVYFLGFYGDEIDVERHAAAIEKIR